MRRLLILLLAVCALASVSLATTTVTGNVQNTALGLLTKNIFVRFEIRNCGNNRPRVIGVTDIVQPTFDFKPDVSGNISGTLYSNDVNIDCGGTHPTEYGVTYYLNNTPVGVTKTYTLHDGVAFNLTTATPNLTFPAVPPVVPNYLVTNAVGDQTIGQPAGTTFTISGDFRVTGVCNGCGGAPGQFVVDGIHYLTIQAAVTAAGTTGSVLIPSNYAGVDTYTNSNKVQIVDLRPKANRQRGYINVLTDCGLKGDGVTDDAAAMTTCMATFGPTRYYFPPTNSSNNPSYFFASSITPPVGSPSSVFTGGANSWLNSNTQLGGTVLKFGAGVTGFNLQNCGCTIEYLSLLGSGGTSSLVNPALLNLPSDTGLPLFTRSISAIQRASNVLTVSITKAVGIEGLTQSVGSTVKISGVTGDATLNGLCIISALSNTGTFGDNPTTFTCPQNGADSGPFTTPGTVSLPTTGTSTADGVHVCNNFTFLLHVSIQNFERHGINADSLAGHGCTVAFSDDLTVRDSFIGNNQGDGYLTIGVDSNAHLLSGNSIYYNVLWGIEDQSSLGNTHIANQISNNGALWAASFTPTTHSISTISRTSGTVSIVLSAADTSVKVGSCVNVSGVTDSSFNNTAGQCYFVTAFTDSKNFQYIQPGAPVDASSSGGTERMGKFAEAYLSAGVDSGAEKISTQSAVSNPTLIGNYAEGGQACKAGNTTLHIGGASSSCATSATGNWTGNYITSNCTGFGGTLCANLGAIIFARDFGGNVNLKAGVSADQTFGFTWLNHSNGIAWSQVVTPTGTLGGAGSFEAVRSGPGQTRLIFFGKDTAQTGATEINAEGTGAVRFNRNFAGTNAGTGGVEFWSGGASPTKVVSVDSTGLATFNGGVIGPFFKSNTANPASAGESRLAKTDQICWRNNGNSADVCISIDGSDNLVLPQVASLASAGGISAPSVTIGGDSAMSSQPRLAWSCFLPGALTSTWTGCQFTPKKAITVVQVELAAKTAPVTCSPNAVIRLTDATSNQDTTLTAGQVTNNISGGQNYAASVALQVKVQTAEAGCGTSGADVNVTVQYKMQ